VRLASGFVGRLAKHHPDIPNWAITLVTSITIRLAA